LKPKKNKNKAKVEIEFMSVTGAKGTTDFIPVGPRKTLPIYGETKK
jgi:hypothetical protein